MVAASRRSFVSADGGGKSKTITQLIAIGFLLGAPMVERDWAYWFSWDAAAFAGWMYQIGYYIFIVGTGLAVWSGWRYVAACHWPMVFGATEDG